MLCTVNRPARRVIEATVAASRFLVSSRVWVRPSGPALDGRTKDAREPPRPAHDLFREDSVHRADHPGLHRRQRPQLPRQRQDPLTNGHVGKDAIDELHGLVAHATRAAARTQATVFAQEGHEHVVSTPLAVAAQEASRDVAAGEVVLESSAGRRSRARPAEGAGVVRVRGRVGRRPAPRVMTAARSGRAPRSRGATTFAPPPIPRSAS